MFKNFIFPRQTTRYTCGPAVLSAVANLVGNPVSEADVMKKTKTEPYPVGTAHEMIEQWAFDNLPIKSSGEDTYEDGLAIANIKNKNSGTGHYVLFLGKKGEVVRYYCPLLGKIIETEESEINWTNSDGTLKRWSINIDLPPEFYDLHIEPEKHVFFFGDPLDELDEDTDTSLALKRQYDKRGIKNSWHTPQDVFTRGCVLYLSGTPVYENDVVWLRLNPANEVSYYTTIQQLCHVNGIFLNFPAAVLTNNDKKQSCSFRRATDVFTVFSEDTINAALKHLTNSGSTKFVVKPPNLFGGKGVLITTSKEEVIDHASTIIESSGCAIIEKYIQPSTERQIDTIVIVTWDRVIGAIAREAKDRNSLTPFQQGSRSKSMKGLTATELSLVSAFQEWMNKKNVFWATLTFLEEELIGVHLTSPGGLTDMNEVYEMDLIYKVVDSAEKYVQKQQR